MLTLDHLAISCADLAAGTKSVSDRLGLPFQDGGQHALFGTHNTLIGMQDGLYLEVIAIDPKAPNPDRPRWFDLDNFRGEPRLSNWICRTKDMDAMRTALPGCGAPIAITRQDLRWKMAVPAEGKLPYDNCHPALIEWQGELHPATMLKPQPLRLIRLTVFHPESDALAAQVEPHLQDARIGYVVRDHAGLEAEFETPLGMRTIS